MVVSRYSSVHSLSSRANAIVQENNAFSLQMISRIALVKCGRTSGSESISRQDMGPFRLYVDKNLFTAGFPSPSAVISSILETVSGDKIP